MPTLTRTAALNVLTVAMTACASATQVGKDAMKQTDRTVAESAAAQSRQRVYYTGSRLPRRDVPADARAIDKDDVKEAVQRSLQAVPEGR